MAQGSPEEEPTAFPYECCGFGAATSQDSWARQNKATTEIVATRDDGKYQAIYLTQEEMNKALPVLVAASDQSTQVEEAIKVLSSLPDGELLNALGKVLNKRPSTIT